MKKQLGVVCIEVMVEGKGGDESAEGCSVHDEKQRTENGALGDATGGGVEGRESVITSDSWDTIPQGDARQRIQCQRCQHIQRVRLLRCRVTQ